MRPHFSSWRSSDQKTITTYFLILSFGASDGQYQAIACSKPFYCQKGIKLITRIMDRGNFSAVSHINVVPNVLGARCSHDKIADTMEKFMNSSKEISNVTDIRDAFAVFLSSFARFVSCICVLFFLLCVCNLVWFISLRCQILK